MAVVFHLPRQRSTLTFSRDQICRLAFETQNVCRKLGQKVSLSFYQKQKTHKPMKMLVFELPYSTSPVASFKREKVQLSVQSHCSEMSLRQCLCRSCDELENLPPISQFSRSSTCSPHAFYSRFISGCWY